MSGTATRSRERAGISARGLWALWFVVASLVALAAVPAYLGQRAADVQSRISDVLDVAGSISRDLLLVKQLQMLRFEAFALTGDRAFREPYEASIAEERALIERLQALSADLDFDVRERLAALSTATESWHFENRRAFSDDAADGALQRSRAGYVELQRSTRELDRAIQSEVNEGRRDLERVRTLQTRLSVALAFLALGAMLVVGRVGWRYHSLGEEAENRRTYAVQARREIDALLEATGDGVLGIDLEGRCTSLNRAGVDLLGYTPREIRGRDVHDTLLHTRPDGSPWPREDSPILSALERGVSADSLDGAVLWRRRGESFPARWSLRPMIDGTELRGAVLTFTDMTEIREKEAALRRAISHREDVVSIVSHDLRNPLGVVLAAADLLLDLPLDEDARRRQAEIIRRSGKRMQNLIEDLLDAARIEEGAFVVHPSVEELEPILEEAHQLFVDQAEEKHVSLSMEVADPTARARIDRDRILQALANLLDNAIRLTPEGGGVRLGMGAANGSVDLTVSDDGPGIEPDLLERLFDRFAQSSSGGGGGAGLGLTIVKGVAEAHGGEVLVDSMPERGATFTIRIPGVAPASRVGEGTSEAVGHVDGDGASV